MSFMHAARLIPEKAVTPPALPMCVLVGAMEKPMSGERKSISKKTRFEVFKRDGFKCVYCGAAAPSAVLVVDHIHPVSKGGENEILNYATACQPCNSGKSDRTLDDQSTLHLQRVQLDELQARRDQLEMLAKWRQELSDIKDGELAMLTNRWSQLAVGFSLNEIGAKQAKAHLKKHGIEACLNAIETAADEYIKFEDGKPTTESVEHAWKKVGGILRLRNATEAEKRLFYVRGILRNRLSYVSPNVIRIMNDALDAGVSVQEIEEEARYASTWTGFTTWLYAAMEA